AGVGAPLDAFLAAVARRADAAAADDGTLPATCFPTGSAVACSFDVDLLAEMGAALSREARALGVDILLGPGVNLRRTPLAGRAYEYYSEDPVLSGDLAGALIAGLQGEGVGVCLKHFACNDSEIERTTMDSVVEERALREVHLAAFARAIAKGRPWTVMSAYNRLGGEQASESRRLLTDILRGDLGFDGLVVSDWHAVKDRPAALVAGCDLDMPENPSRRAALAAALADGRLPREALDEAAARVLA
ncbi:glycoside hydrolase family 3 protein, partial [Oharaeibacter diazotrophicus]